MILNYYLRNILNCLVAILNFLRLAHEQDFSKIKEQDNNINVNTFVSSDSVLDCQNKQIIQYPSRMPYNNVLYSTIKTIDMQYISENEVIKRIIETDILKEEARKRELKKQELFNSYEFKNNEFTGSKIIYCLIKDKKSGKIISENNSKYMLIVKDIWRAVPRKSILTNSTFNISSTDKYGINGYKWCKEFQMSIQNKIATSTLKEIVHMCCIHNYSVYMIIDLKTVKDYKIVYNN